MIHIKTVIVAAVIALGSCLGASAKTTQLTFKLSGGRTIVVDLTATGTGENKQLPLMTFTPSTVQIVLPPKEATEPGETTVPAVYTFEIEDLYHASVETGTTAINDIIAEGNSIVIAPLGGDLVRITGDKSVNAEAVKVYDMAGREQIVEVTADNDSSLTVSLAQLRAGVYIVNISSHSLKITKR